MPNSIEYVDVSSPDAASPCIEVVVGKTIVMGQILRNADGQWSYHSAFKSAPAIAGDQLEAVKRAVAEHIAALRSARDHD